MAVRNSLWLSLMPVLLTGCMFGSRSAPLPHHTANTYVHQIPLPENIRRVAILPIPRDRSDASHRAGAETLEPVLINELRKRNVIEIIVVSPEQLRLLTGKSQWSADDQLPPDFLEQLSQRTGCDAVIFASLTSFHAYPPLRVGWKARLIDCDQQQTWWAVDEVFDAASIPIAKGAQAYAARELTMPHPLVNDTGVLHSPRRFGQYAAYAVVNTLPPR